MVSPKLKERPLIVIDPGEHSQDVFWMEFVEVARKHEWRLFNINNNKRRLPDDMEPNGAVLAAFADDPVTKELKKRGCLCIRHGRYPHQFDNVLPAVFPDRNAIGRLAAEHYAARGFKHVAMIVNVPRANWDVTYDGFHARAAELDMQLHILERPMKGDRQPIEEALEGWLPALSKPVGILAYHEYLGAKIYQAAQMLGLLVPQEVAILSAFNSYVCELTPVPITAVEEDVAAAGRETALLLKRMLDGETPPPSISIPPKQIVLRQSTDVLAVQDLTVAKALSYIWEYYNWPLTVDDIALEVNVSRSTLERRFRRYLGRGVNAELRRKRLERCCELLKTTSMSIAELVKECGFQHRGYLHRTFFQAYGMTPGHFRQQAKTTETTFNS